MTEEEQKKLFEELSGQIARKDKIRQEMGITMRKLEHNIKKIAIQRNVPKPTLNELPPEDRIKISAITSLLDELHFLAKEANQEYLLDCWLDIKSKYYQLSRNAKNLIKPKITVGVTKLGKQFRI